MKTLESLQFDPSRCTREVRQFVAWIAQNQTLDEKRHILPFFRERRHLAALVGSYGKDLHQFDRIAYEYPLFGDFVCDLVVGDSARHAYCLIEFEDAGPRSLFVKRSRKATREWAPRFERGYSQIIDWFHKLDDLRRSDDLVTRFGSRLPTFSAALVIGRDHHLRAGELERLAWRRANVAVSSQRVECVTLDELAAHLRARVAFFQASPRGRR